MNTKRLYPTVREHQLYRDVKKKHKVKESTLAAYNVRQLYLKEQDKLRIDSLSHNR